MAERKVIQTDNAPQAIGPYSQAVRAGNVLYVSGQLGLEPVSGNLVEGGIEAETEQSLVNVQAILKDAGFSLSDVVKVQIFVSDINDFGKVNEIYGRFFSEPFPARAVVQVGGIPKNGKIELVTMAVKSE